MSHCSSKDFSRSLLHDMTEKFNPSKKFLQYLDGIAYNAGVLTHVYVLLHVADFRQLQFVGAQKHTVYPPLAHHRGDAPTEATLLLQFLGYGLAQAGVCIRWGPSSGLAQSGLAFPKAQDLSVAAMASNGDRDNYNSNAEENTKQC
jgi:hypothetical protein